MVLSHEVELDIKAGEYFCVNAYVEKGALRSGNLLDNALNACLQQNGGEIKVSIQTIENTFTIHVTNTYNSSEIKLFQKNIDS